MHRKMQNMQENAAKNAKNVHNAEDFAGIEG